MYNCISVKNKCKHFFICCNRLPFTTQIQNTGEVKKSEKALKNRMMTIDELQKEIDSVSSDAFQVKINFFSTVYRVNVPLLHLNRLIC